MCLRTQDKLVWSYQNRLVSETEKYHAIPILVMINTAHARFNQELRTAPPPTLSTSFLTLLHVYTGLVYNVTVRLWIQYIQSAVLVYLTRQFNVRLKGKVVTVSPDF